MTGRRSTAPASAGPPPGIGRRPHQSRLRRAVRPALRDGRILGPHHPPGSSSCGPAVASWCRCTGAACPALAHVGRHHLRAAPSTLRRSCRWSVMPGSTRPRSTPPVWSSDWDDDQAVDPGRLGAALTGPAYAVGSGVTIGAEEPIAGLWLRLTVAEAGTGPDRRRPAAVDRGLCRPAVPARCPVLGRGWLAGLPGRTPTLRSGRRPGHRARRRRPRPGAGRARGPPGAGGSAAWAADRDRGAVGGGLAGDRLPDRPVTGLRVIPEAGRQRASLGY